MEHLLGDRLLPSWQEARGQSQHPRKPGSFYVGPVIRSLNQMTNPSPRLLPPSSHGICPCKLKSNAMAWVTTRSLDISVALQFGQCRIAMLHPGPLSLRQHSPRVRCSTQARRGL